MGRIQEFLNTARASGMSLDESVHTLLAGTAGPPIPLGDILADLQSPLDVLIFAAAAARAMEDLKVVSTALVEHGVHPLSLLLGHGADLQRWILNNDREAWRFHHRWREPQSELHWGNLRLQRFQPTTWLRKLPPGLNFVFGPEVETLVLSDSSLTGLLHSDMIFEAHLKILACEGLARLPARIRGRLQIHFSEGRFHFPQRMDLDGILEIRGCPGINQLPEVIRTEGLYIDHCPSLTALPRIIQGARQIDLVALPLESFPEGIEGVSYFRMARAPGLKCLPLPSGPSLNVELVRLPALLTFHPSKQGVLRDLSISHCDSLQGLPPGLTSLAGSLELRHLPQLTSLPEGLAVAKDLLIFDCPALRSLPEGLTVGGVTEIHDCPDLHCVPEEIAPIRT